MQAESSQVYYHESHYDLNASNGHTKFVRQLYNLCSLLEMEEETEDTEVKILELQKAIQIHDKRQPMKSFHTKGSKSSHSDDDD